MQAGYGVELGRTVGPELFWPRPKVESAVAHLRRLAEPLSREELARLSSLCSVLFQRRRQALGRVLGEALGDREGALELLAELGIDPASRAETLDLGQLRALSGSTGWRDRQ